MPTTIAAPTIQRWALEVPKPWAGRGVGAAGLVMKRVSEQRGERLAAFGVAAVGAAVVAGERGAVGAVCEAGFDAAAAAGGVADDIAGADALADADAGGKVLHDEDRAERGVVDDAAGAGPAGPEAYVLD